LNIRCSRTTRHAWRTKKTATKDRTLVAIVLRINQLPKCLYQ
jgi:hypothetical protein